MSRAPASILDYRELASRRLPHFLFEYLDGGSYGEATLRRNLADLEAVELRQRVLTDVAHLDLSTVLFGQQWRLPVALGPIGLAGSGDVNSQKAKPSSPSGSLGGSRNRTERSYAGRNGVSAFTNGAMVSSRRPATLMRPAPAM